MSAGFTPGPWEASERAAENGITGRPSASYVIPSSLTDEERKYPHDYAVARAFTSLNGFDPVAEREANARLIAAAPDYDTFTEKALPLLEVLHSTCQSPDTRKTVWSCILAGRAALAKARGEA